MQCTLSSACDVAAMCTHVLRVFPAQDLVCQDEREDGDALS